MTEKKRVQNPKLRIVAFAQEIDPELWNWSDDEKARMKSGDPEKIGEVIYLRLVQAGLEVSDFHLGLHDKDSSKKWDDNQRKRLTVVTRKHVHGVLRFASGSRETLDKLAEIIGLEPQYLEKAGRGKYAFDNMLSYLIHAKDDDKYQYDPDEIVAIVGRSYRGIYEENKERWFVGRAKKQRKRATETFDGLWEKCFSGEVKKEELLLNDEYRRIYAQNRRQINDALDAYAERRAYEAAQALKDGLFKLSVIYVQGQPGVGKSYFARRLLDKLREPGWDLYEAASRNALDDWSGQEMILMDDLRGVAMSASDWLKLLDPEQSSPAAARYNNKQHVAPRVVVLTSPLPASVFFLRAIDSENEAMDQFMRRLTMQVEVVKAEDHARQYFVGRVKEIGPYLKGREVLRYGVDQYAVLDEIDRAVDVVAGEIVSRNDDVEPLPYEWDALPKKELELLRPYDPGQAISAEKMNPWLAPGDQAKVAP